MSTTQTPLTLQAGEPFTATVTVVGGKNRWATLDAFEVRSQVRRTARQTDDLIVDLTPYLSKAYSGDDIVIGLFLSGAVTRTLADRKGFYDMFVSDPGVTDNQALKVMNGTITIVAAVTSAS